MGVARIRLATFGHDQGLAVWFFGGEFSLARSFRVVPKKRGDRRTGSHAWGTAGEAAFFLLLFLLGCAGLATLFFVLIVPEGRANREFVETPCTVLDRRVVEERGEDGPRYRPEIKIQYQLGDESYHTWTYDVHGSAFSDQQQARRITDRFQPGQQTVCWYDPADPSVAILIRGFSWWNWLALIVPIPFVIVGGAGFVFTLVQWGTSAERRSAIARRAADLEILGQADSRREGYPTVPAADDIINSPGTTLKYRLPVAGSPAWVVFGLLLCCLLWNGFVAFLLFGAIRGYVEGQPDWFLTIFLIPFLAIGVILVVVFVRQLLMVTGIGPTQIEISDHPLRPGQRFRLFLSQSGHLKVNALCVHLLCTEEATYRQGTDTRKETRCVYRELLSRREHFEVQRGLPYETECDAEIALGAMHSFRAAHNQICWRVVVEADVDGWSNYRRVFPLIVSPRASAAEND